MWNLAIDFGTSNTTGATWSDGVVTPLEVDGRPHLPSVVLLSADGSWMVGRSADNQAVIVPERVERAPKRRLGKGTSLLLGGTAVPITDAVAALITPFADAARERHGGQPDHVVLTHPARWGPERINVLRDAARAVGFERVELIPEPVAAAHDVDDQLEVGHHVAVYDLGGGTFDTCVMRRTETTFKVVGLPGGNERIGGEDFDHRVYQHLGEIIARDDPAAWESIQTSTDREWRRAAAELLEGARRAKEQLSRNPRASVYVGALERDVTLTRDEFEALIVADVDRTVVEMTRSIESAGLTEGDVDRVYLVGGSSRLPLVQQRMGSRFAGRLGTWDDPKGAVVRGAAGFSASLVAGDTGAAGSGSASPGSGTSSGVIGTLGPSAAPTAPASTTPSPPAPSPTAPPSSATWNPASSTGWSAPQSSDPAWAPAAPSWSAPSDPYGGGQRGSDGASTDELTYAWIGAATALILCLPGPAVGLYFAYQAREAGRDGADAALVANVAAIAVVLLAWILIIAVNA